MECCQQMDEMVEHEVVHDDEEAEHDEQFGFKLEQFYEVLQ